VEAGEFAAGKLLPSESNLGSQFNASRVTVRKALEELRDEGLLASRQGLGWYATSDLVRQSLEDLDTIETRLAQSGFVPKRQVIDFSFTRAPATVRRALGIERVLEVRRLNLADGAPFARVTVWCPQSLGSQFSRDDVEARPFYDLLGEIAGITLGSATQTIVASAASAQDAELLGVPTGSPVLVCERVTRSLDGTPVLFSEQVYPGHRMALTVDLTSDRGTEPARLRFVE